MMLVHEKIVIRASTLMDLEKIIGIEALTSLSKDGVIELIDDSNLQIYSFLGFERALCIFPSDENILEIIARDFQRKHHGMLKSKYVPELITTLESNIIKVDTDSLIKIIYGEVKYDLSTFEEKKSDQSPLSSLHGSGIFLRLLAKFNRALVLQNMTHSGFISSNEYHRRMLNTKLSPVFRKYSGSVPDELFKEIISDRGIPMMGKLIFEGAITFNDILDIRNDINGKKFRHWIEKEHWDREEIYKKLLSLNTNLSKKIWMKVIRWAYPTIASFGLGSLIGIGVQVFDSFVLEKLLDKWDPKLFLDSTLENKITSIQNET